MGNNQDPVTLHKYLYANADPVTYTDPTGNFSMGSMMSAIGTIGTLAGVGYTSYDITSMFISGSDEVTAKDVGGAILLGLIGNKILKPIAKACKSSGKKSNRCKLALGWTMAHAKMRVLVWSTPNSRLQKGTLNRIIMVIGAYDIKRGVGVAATNGDHNGASGKLRSHARKFGLGVGEEKACRTRNTVGRCAEWRSADKLLKGKSKIANIRWTRPRYVDPGVSGFAKLRSYTDPCGICVHVNFK